MIIKYYPKISISIYFVLILSSSLGAKEFVLPPLDLEETDQLSNRSSILVNAYEFEGNVVFYDFELAEIAAPYANREISLEELEELRRKLTLAYTQKGYINSGVILKDQDISDGIIVFNIIEGELTDIDIEGNKRLRNKYLKKRIRRKAGPPLNIRDLQERLQLIRLNPNIRTINAELKPGLSLGQSSLSVKIKEEQPWKLTLGLDNYRTPGVGAERFYLNVSHSNVFGISDQFFLGYGITKDGLDEIDFAGLDDVTVSYALPLNSMDTTLSLSYKKRDFTIVEDPFDELNIESETEEFSISLLQPIIKTPTREFSLSLTGERRQSNSKLLSESFSFSQGSVKGRTRVTVLRFVQEWVQRNLSQVMALRSSFNFGVDALHPSKSKLTSRDGEFFSWLGQLQYIRRAKNTNNHFIFRTSAQFSNDKLLSLEQFSVGGSNSVRGYRENTLVRDRGIVTTFELRIPIWHQPSGKEILWLAPFFDYGWASNVGAKDEAFEVIASMGSGILLNINDWLDAQVYWGHQIRDSDRPEDDLQDKGFHFQVSVKFK